jgi:hypothetical protein
MILAFVMDGPSARVYQSGDGHEHSGSARVNIVDAGLKPFAAGLQLTDVPL